MALIYYRDNAYAPVAGGNAYATRSQIDPLLQFHPRWKYLDDPMKDEAIIAASAQIDIMSYSGVKVSPTQPLQFPRQYNETDGVFAVEQQDRRLVQAVSAQVEYNLARAGIGMTAYSHGNESLTPRQEIICREAQFALEPYREG
jgi:hypothetical protein